MFNVLPDILKKEIKTDYRYRRLLIVFLCIFFLQLSFLVFLFPSWVTSVYMEREIISQIDDISRSSTYQDVDTISSTITSTNLKLKIINSNLEYPKLIPIVNVILANKISGIHINEFIYTSSDGKTAAISLSGISSSREVLMNYVKILDKSGSFKNVESPISNLAKDKDFDFSINLSVSL